MKKTILRCLKYAALLMLVIASRTPHVSAQVVCNKFRLNTKITDSILVLSVDTDLPDDTIGKLSVNPVSIVSINNFI